MQFRIETPRLILLVLKGDSTNAAAVTSFLQRDQELFELYEPDRLLNFYTNDFQKTVLKHEYNTAISCAHIRYYVFRKENPEEIIGTVCLHNIQSNYYGRCELGYKFSSAHHHKGYAKEALGHVILAAFEELNLHRINAWVESSNAPSIKLLERLGFEQEALCKEYVYIQGAWKDHYQYTMINPFASDF